MEGSSANVYPTGSRGACRAASSPACSAIKSTGQKVLSGRAIKSTREETRTTKLLLQQCIDWTQLPVLTRGMKLNVLQYRLELQAYGKTHFSWRGGHRYRIEISCGGSGKAAARRLRHFSGFTGT